MCTDRISAGVQIEIRENLRIPLGEIPLESGTLKVRAGTFGQRHEGRLKIDLLFSEQIQPKTLGNQLRR